MDLFSIQSSSLSAQFTPHGASLVSLKLNGHDFNLVLRLADSLYPAHRQHFGAVAGPLANRIAGGRVQINGCDYQLDRNEGGVTCLHGGSTGMGRQLWHLHEQSQNRLSFRLEIADGADGLPGNRVAEAHYQLDEDGTYSVELVMRTDAPTFCNLTTHPYFCLDDSGSVRSHLLRLAAARYLALDDQKIPTGETLPLSNSAFDFTKSAPLSMLMTEAAPIFDHNVCLNSDQSDSDGLTFAAELKSLTSGITMQLRTNQPGLQLYCPPELADELVDEQGQHFAPFPALCLEPQGWPDAPHHPEFPSILITPEAPYRHKSQYRFTMAAD